MRNPRLRAFPFVQEPDLRPASSNRVTLPRSVAMLLTIAIILLTLWALGVFAFKVTAGLIHILLIVAIVVGLIQLFRGRRSV